MFLALIVLVHGMGQAFSQKPLDPRRDRDASVDLGVWPLGTGDDEFTLPYLSIQGRI
jgi:hypothetical protein